MDHNELLHIPVAIGGLLTFLLDQYDRAKAKYGDMYSNKIFWQRNWSGLAKNGIAIIMVALLCSYTNWDPGLEFSFTVGYGGSAVLKSRWAKKGHYQGLLNGKGKG